MDNVGIVVEDLDRAIEFFEALGMELEGTALIDGDWAARVVGLDQQVVDIAMMRIPTGDGRVELARYRSPAAVRTLPYGAPANTLGYRRIMFEVDDIDAMVQRLCALGGELAGEIARYADVYRLCYLHGPEGIVIGLAQPLR
ncbi:MAG: VOC family protein [Actinobacteria bacterium]|nr:VOC family protein [Actinomycetota bacterium]MCB9390310.1 VOC family protein [Acidimicrobiia bacterium]